MEGAGRNSVRSWVSWGREVARERLVDVMEVKRKGRNCEKMD